MKKLATRSLVLAVGFLGLSAMADDIKVPSEPKAQVSAPAPAAQAPAPTATAAKTEKTEHNFEDLLVQGKYHFSDEAVTTVEEDKVLDSLLGIRTDFKDKIEQSAGRY